MIMKKKLASVLIVGSALGLSACSEDDLLDRNTEPAPITISQAGDVAAEVGGLALNDFALENIVDVGGGSSPASVTKVLGVVKKQSVHAAAAPGSTYTYDCTDGGTRTEKGTTVDGYDYRQTFNNCKEGDLTLNGNVDLYEGDDEEGANFAGLSVQTAYDGGTLKLVFTGDVAVAEEYFSDGGDEYEYYYLDIDSLTIDGTVSKSGRDVGVKLVIRDYSRELSYDSADEERELRVSGRLTKSGDFGTYDVDLSNIPVDGSDELRRIFSGSYYGGNFLYGRLHIVDRLKSGNFLSLAPTDEDEEEELEQGEKVSFTGKIESTTIDTLLEWDDLEPLFIFDIFGKR